MVVMLHNKVNIFNNTIMHLKMAKRVHFGLGVFNHNKKRSVLIY